MAGRGGCGCGGCGGGGTTTGCRHRGLGWSHRGERDMDVDAVVEAYLCDVVPVVVEMVVAMLLLAVTERLANSVPRSHVV